MRPELVIFDCDGVLIDSENIAAEIIADDLTALGWSMTPAKCNQLFVGMSIRDMEPIIAAYLGRDMGPAWREELAQKLLVALASSVTIIDGARDVLTRVTAMGIPWRVASNSSREEMGVKFVHTGLSDLMAGRIHAAADLFASGGKPKPAPDIYLAAAAAETVEPKYCVVVEDSERGVMAAVAAGMRTYGFAPHGDGAALLGAGAISLLRNLHEIFEVIT